ncbi:MAG: hypothetical protein KKH99_07690, partial [Proteobacteria bacterium]|nr:hypothetical protein [Pseudomonadota bacterium]
MPSFQVKNTNYTVRIICILFAVFMISGCVAQDAQAPKTSDSQQMKAAQAPENVENDRMAEQREIRAVNFNETNEAIEINIQGNQKLGWTSIKQDFPFGIAIYLPETKIAKDFIPPVSEYKSIGNLIVTYADKEETTVKVEILLNQDLNYEVVEGEDTLKVSLSNSPVPTVETAGSSEDEPESVASQKIADVDAGAKSDLSISKQTATMTNIEFNTMEDGKSDIVVQTSHPIEYDMTQGKDGKLYLNLYNTVVPYYHQRALLTHYFKSAVESLMPHQAPGKEKKVKIEIQTRDTVPYRVVQNQNVISVFFEPSTI